MGELTQIQMKELADFKLFLIQEKKDKKRLQRGARTVSLHIELLTRLIKSVPALTIESINAFLLSLYEKGRKGTYLNDYVDMLHIYGRFKQTKLYEAINYFPEEEFVSATMSDEEINSFLLLPPPSTERYNHKSKSMVTYHYAKGWDRWNMFWKLVSFHPVRLGEVAHLTVENVDFGLEVLQVNGKTGKRTVPIHPAVLEDVKKFIASLTTPQLFPSLRGGKGRQGGVLDDVDWGYNFHNRLKRLGIKRTNLRPYSLRHSSITRLADTDVNPFVLMRMSGHKRIDTTLRYYHESLKKKKEAIRKDPLGRKLLEYNERFKMFRELTRKGLEDFALNPEEERKMLKALIYE